MKRVVLFCLTFLFWYDAFGIIKPKRVESIPFEMVGSYVVITVRINDSSPLNLILDSGVRNTIITELQSGDRITLNYSDVKDLMGLGGGMISRYFGFRIIWGEVQKTLIIFHTMFEWSELFKLHYERCDRPNYWGWTWYLQLGRLLITKTPEAEKFVQK